MPTERFYRLPEKKREVIRQAAIKEFARVPFEKASINQIIQNAEISRGSFYTYFEDKQDVVTFIFEEGGVELERYCRNLLEQNGGNYFSLMEGVFEYFIEALSGAKEMLQMLRNVFAYHENANAMGFDCIPGEFTDCDRPKPMQNVVEAVDWDSIHVKSEQERDALMSLGGASLMFAIAQYYKTPDRLEEIRAMFHDKLDIMRYGVMNR